MLTIIHGSDVTASRKFFLDQKSHADTFLLQEDEVSLTHLSQLLEGGGLFENIKTICIEQFLTKRQKSVEKEAILTYLKNQSKTHNIILWEGKALTLAMLTPFKNATIKIFKLPSTLFALLDAIKPQNSRQLIQLFHQSLETTEAEMIFFMLVRQFRIMLCLSVRQAGLTDKLGENISEVARIAPWQRSKFEKQANSFTKDKLQELYSKLFTIERGQKTGGLTSPLISTIDFFFTEI